MKNYDFGEELTEEEYKKFKIKAVIFTPIVLIGLMMIIAIIENI